jgi:uncharacterized protein YdaU (DUF1376 family)
VVSSPTCPLHLSVMTNLDGVFMHYYQHHIGDFIKDTSFLTNEEVGIYMKLLWLYYDTEKPLPDSLFELSMKVNGRDKEQVISGLLNMFFTLEEGSWHHKRCDREIGHYHQQLESASKAGKASAAKRAMNKRSTGVQQPFNERSTTEQLTNNQQPITNNQQPTINTRSASSLRPDDVDESVWADFKALRKAKKSPITDTAIKGIRKEASNAGISLEKALQLCCARGWQGFKAEWVTDDLKKDDHYKQSLDIIFGRNRREKDITPRQDLLEG